MANFHDKQIILNRQIEKTRASLQRALISLLDELPYDAISVQMITTRADTGRSTFYDHFKNKHDLLQSGFTGFLQQITDSIRLDNHARRLIFSTVPLFEHARRHWQIYHCLQRGQGAAKFEKRVHLTLSEQIETRLKDLRWQPELSGLPLTIWCYSAAGMLLMLLKWWLEHGMTYDAEMMDLLFQKTLINSVNIVAIPAC